jgi:hypothetical protein
MREIEIYALISQVAMAYLTKRRTIKALITVQAIQGWAEMISSWPQMMEGLTGNSIVTNYSSSLDRRKSEAAKDLS